MAKILIIDDSKICHLNMTNLFSHEKGLELLFAVNGQQGLEMVEKERPDLILCDVLMPILDGIGFLEKLRARNNYTRVIVVTAEIQEAVVKRCQELGVVAVVTKPIVGVHSDLLGLVKGQLNDCTFGRKNLVDEKSTLIKQLLSQSIDKSIAGFSELSGDAAMSESEWIEAKDILTKIGKTWGTSCCAVSMSFESSVSGVAGLIFSKENFYEVATIITGTDGNDLDSLALQKDSIAELGNTITNRVIGFISNRFGIEFRFSPPVYARVSNKDGAFTENLIQTVIQFGSTITSAKVLFIRRRLAVKALNKHVDFICLFEDSENLRKVLL